jgi:hypothetical protein
MKENIIISKNRCRGGMTRNTVFVYHNGSHGGKNGIIKESFSGIFDVRDLRVQYHCFNAGILIAEIQDERAFRYPISLSP